MPIKVDRKKWILYKHLKDFDTLCKVGLLLKSYVGMDISSEYKQKLADKLEQVDLYSKRRDDAPLDATSHKINQLSFYMFGYQSEKKFLFSPLGNLLLNNYGNQKYVSKIFLTMLWSMQFTHPHSGTLGNFQLYPFRLLYQLLTDKKLDGKLYAFEYVYLIAFVENVEHHRYDELVSKILKLRVLSNEELKKLFETDSHVYVNAAHEWDYYVSEFLCSAGVLEKDCDSNIICRLQHGNTDTFRKITRNVVRLPDCLRPFVQRLQLAYPFTDKPLRLDDAERLGVDVVKEIYSFYPKELLEEIGELDDKFYDLLQFPKLIEQYADNHEGTKAYLFEDVLETGFNMFYNVEARKIGGSGNTDLECLYLTKKIKFAVDAKSTKNKLSLLNAGRLDSHRDKIGAVYTIVITPRYVPAVLNDIKHRSIVIILASVFAEFLYNCIRNRVEMDYADFDNIITRHLGQDVSKLVSDLTLSKFASNTEMRGGVE